VTRAPEPIPEEPDQAEAEAGRRSGEGTRSLWGFMTRDARERAPSIEGPPSLLGDLGADSPGRSRSRSLVLVVDDNEASRYAKVRALRAAGFDTLEAPGGALALELSLHASAVVLDVHLPDVHGLEVCRLIRARPETARLPIVHVSAKYVTEEDRRAAAQAGGDLYLVAPVESDVLVAELDRLLLRSFRGSPPQQR
jgi:CheY-like chemotaxis protein